MERQGFPEKYHISLGDIAKAVGDIALDGMAKLSFLPQRVLSPVVEAFQRETVSRATQPFEQLGECVGQQELDLGN